MEKCAGCHWHCTEIRRCKSMSPKSEEIDCTKFETGLYSMSGVFLTSSKCKPIYSGESQSATA